MELRSIGGEPVVLLDTYEVDEAQGPTGPHPSGFPAGAKVARVARFASVDVVASDTLDAADTPQPTPTIAERGQATPNTTGTDTTREDAALANSNQAGVFVPDETRTQNPTPG